MSGLAPVRQPGASAHCPLPCRSSGHLLGPSQDEEAAGLAWLTHPHPHLTNLLCPSNSPSRESPNTPQGSPLRPLPTVPPACRAPVPSVIRVTSSERPSQNSLAVMSPLPRCACAHCCLIFLLFAHLPPTSRREAPPWDPSLGPCLVPVSCSPSYPQSLQHLQMAGSHTLVGQIIDSVKAANHTLQ